MGRHGKGSGTDLIVEGNFKITLNLDIEKYTKELDEFVAALKTPNSEITGRHIAIMEHKIDAEEYTNMLTKVR